MSTEGQQSCPSCDEPFEPSQYGGICPECYTTHPDYEDDEDAAAGRAGGGESSAGEANESGEQPAAAIDGVTLVVNGGRYNFEDGDTFGRRGDEWLEDLIEAADGKEGVKYVSGEHLEFSIEDDGAYVTDVSSNGTALNGTDIDGDSAKLEDGDTLVLANQAEVEVEL